jgi:hypothetical protein
MCKIFICHQIFREVSHVPVHLQASAHPVTGAHSCARKLRGQSQHKKTPRISRIKHGLKMKYNFIEIRVIRGVFYVFKAEIPL